MPWSDWKRPGGNDVSGTEKYREIVANMTKGVPSIHSGVSRRFSLRRDGKVISVEWSVDGGEIEILVMEEKWALHPAVVADITQAIPAE